jgi:hypothetical protein
VNLFDNNSHILCITYVSVHTVPIGGQLFQAYLELLSGYTTYRMYKSALSRMKKAGSISLSVEDNKALLHRSRTLFTGYLIYHMNMVSRQAKKQQFFLNFIVKYYGLSRRGINVLSKYGYLTSLKYMDDQVDVEVMCAKQQTR